MAVCRKVKGGVCSAKGFRAAGVAAEIKYKGRNDVALIVADAPCSAAAVFTTNKVAAAPVVYDRSVVKGGKVQAILANSGCANACTGEQGLEDARLSALVTAGELGLDPHHVLVASTGVIGRRLPVDRLLAGMKAATKALGRTGAHGLAAAKAIMTTDTRSKEACATVTIGGKKVTVGGMSKGSGMIEPNMATMLGFLTTDAAVSPRMLKRALQLAVGRSFNRLVVDGDESTNDSLFILASGKAGNREIDAPGKDFDAFRAALETVCISLARQMATDGEGATKFVTVGTRRRARSACRREVAACKDELVRQGSQLGSRSRGRRLLGRGCRRHEVGSLLRRRMGVPLREGRGREAARTAREGHAEGRILRSRRLAPRFGREHDLHLRPLARLRAHQRRLYDVKEV